MDKEKTPAIPALKVLQWGFRYLLYWIAACDTWRGGHGWQEELGKAQYQGFVV